MIEQRTQFEPILEELYKIVAMPYEKRGYERGHQQGRKVGFVEGGLCASCFFLFAICIWALLR